MKKHYKEIPFIEQLEKVPNVSLACEIVGIARNTFYRWCSEDPDFKARMEKALIAGTNSVNDLAESKLITHINNGNMRAIQYWLDNNKKNYIKPRPKVEQQPFVPVTKIEILTPDKHTAKVSKGKQKSKK